MARQFNAGLPLDDRQDEEWHKAEEQAASITNPITLGNLVLLMFAQSQSSF